MPDAIRKPGGKWHEPPTVTHKWGVRICDLVTRCGRWTRDMQEYAPIDTIPSADLCCRCWPSKEK